jgi:hypothetical protein
LRSSPNADQQHEFFPAPGELLYKTVGFVEMVAGQAGEARVNTDDFQKGTFLSFTLGSDVAPELKLTLAWNGLQSALEAIPARS